MSSEEPRLLRLLRTRQLTQVINDVEGHYAELCKLTEEVLSAMLRTIISMETQPGEFAAVVVLCAAARLIQRAEYDEPNQSTQMSSIGHVSLLLKQAMDTQLSGDLDSEEERSTQVPPLWTRPLALQSRDQTHFDASSVYVVEDYLIPNAHVFFASQLQGDVLLLDGLREILKEYVFAAHRTRPDSPYRTLHQLAQATVAFAPRFDGSSSGGNHIAAGTHLTPAHVLLVQESHAASYPAMALEVMKKTVLQCNFSRTGSLPHDAVVYFFYGSLILASLSAWHHAFLWSQRASQALLLCPHHSLATALNSQFRLLAEIVGKPLDVNEKEVCLSVKYVALVQSARKCDRATFESCIAQLSDGDDLRVIAKELLNANLRRKARNIARIYSTISIPRIVEELNVNVFEEVMDIYTPLIKSGELRCHFDMSKGIAWFEDAEDVLAESAAMVDHMALEKLNLGWYESIEVADERAWHMMAFANKKSWPKLGGHGPDDVTRRWAIEQRIEALQTLYQTAKFLLDEASTDAYTLLE